MENSTQSSSSPTISKKTGALVFFVGCAIGLVISEILVGVASQKASQEAHKASEEYIQQVRKGGSVSVDKHGKIKNIPANPKTPPGPGVKHLATLQSTVLVSRADNIQRSAEELEWEKEHKIQETKTNGKRNKDNEKLKPHPRRNIRRHRKKHPQTVSLIRIRTAGDGRIITKICHPADKNCASVNKKANTNNIQADSKSVNQPVKPHRAIRMKRRALSHSRSHRNHPLDVKSNPVVIQSVSVPTASPTTPPPSTKQMPTKKPGKKRKGKRVKVDRSVKKTKIKANTNSTTPTGSKGFGIFKKSSNTTSEKHHKAKTQKSSKMVTKTTNSTVVGIKQVKSKGKSSSSPTKQKSGRRHPFVFKKISTNSSRVQPAAKSHPPPKHSKLGTMHKQDHSGTVLQQNTTIKKVSPTGKSNATVSKKWWKFPSATGVTEASKTTTTKKHKKLKHQEKIKKKFLQSYSQAEVQQDVPAPQSSSWSSPYSANSADEWNNYNSAEDNAGSNLDLSPKPQNALDVPPVQLDRKHRESKNERACKRMMRDMEAFEKDEQQKSEELMMVSFRDGVDEVQTLMHSWVKTPVHVMEALTFVSILMCMILYWVEDSIQSRLRKIGFNI